MHCMSSKVRTVLAVDRVDVTSTRLLFVLDLLSWPIVAAVFAARNPATPNFSSFVVVSTAGGAPGSFSRIVVAGSDVTSTSSTSGVDVEIASSSANAEVAGLSTSTSRESDMLSPRRNMATDVT